MSLLFLSAVDVNTETNVGCLLLFLSAVDVNTEANVGEKTPGFRVGRLARLQRFNALYQTKAKWPANSGKIRYVRFSFFLSFFLFSFFLSVLDV